MYLKSLVLKGFKSFADRSVLSLEPGVTAIVGPNGSGKSNISDAVLWVLGERSARNLRGQAMEDIIFSGSAARKAVSVAEAELILDNSDGTLPIDYDEVSIARRLYRSGESEYLINGVIARRLDVLDILHDSGLGTGTHSIISQGSLDSILQSRPEDRRALIEEAAGVLKHRQRKERAERKLATMDNHLARARDVAAEVARQMGPLERKAKRAKAYKAASEELAELKLALAVDDLRALQKRWDKVCADEQELAAQLEQKRETVEQAERTFNDLQEIIRRDAQDAGELSKRQRRASKVSERLDSAEMLLRERRRAAQSSQADAQTALEDAASRRQAAQQSLEDARAQHQEAMKSHEEARAVTERLAGECDEAIKARRDAEKALSQIEADLRTNEKRTTEAKRRQEELKDSLSNGLAHERLVEARKVELVTELERAKEDHERAAAHTKASGAALAEIEEAERSAQQALVAAFEQREEARERRTASLESLRVVEAEMKAIEQALKAGRADRPALQWVLDNAGRFGSALDPVSKSLKAPQGLEGLVEMLVGEEISALAVEDEGQARAIAEALADARLAGDVSLVIRSDASRACPARQLPAGSRALVDELSCAPGARNIVEALLGDVVLCSDLEEMFSLASRDENGARYITESGCLLGPSGKMRIFGKNDQSDDDGVLARERRLSELGDQRAKAEEAARADEAGLERAEQVYREAQAESLKLSQDLATKKGAADAARAEEQRTAHKLSMVAAEMEDVEKQAESAKLAVEQIRPDAESVRREIEELASRRDELVSQRDEKNDALSPLRRTVGRLREELSDAKLKEATLAERGAYAERLVTARVHDVEVVESSTAQARRTMAYKRHAIARAGEALGVLEVIAACLLRHARVLDEALDASEANANGIHAHAAQAREEARKAHAELDDANGRMTESRIEKSRLELQVETAVNVVTRDCQTPLDHAFELPELEDRVAVEDSVFKLERKIKNMGTINPDAAEEYEAVKQRYDYLARQLGDLDAARRSLNRIVRVIDSRMKGDFLRTFNEVNDNFNEIFSLLFPGGSASLSLEDPDDLEHTGVEVTAQPRGKRLTKMMLMSGGEKSLTALALLFAVYKARSTPFYILDEVEAALDDTNLRRLISYIDTLRASTQLVMITHQRRTMEMADVLFGVSMQADGVTKVISQKLERALELAE